MRRKWNHTTPPGIQDCPVNNTSVFVGQQVERWANGDGRYVHPEIAMEIAAGWQAPSNPALTLFASDGTVPHGSLLAEIEGELFVLRRQHGREVAGQRLELQALRAYVEAVLIFAS